MRRSTGGSFSSSPGKSTSMKLPELVSKLDKDNSRRWTSPRSGCMCFAAVVMVYCTVFFAAMAVMRQTPKRQLDTVQIMKPEQAAPFMIIPSIQFQRSSIQFESFNVFNPFEHVDNSPNPFDQQELLDREVHLLMTESIKRDEERGIADDGEPWKVKRKRWASVRYGTLDHDIPRLLRHSVDESKYIVDDVLDRFRNQPHVTIRGFYSSGTNWLRALITRNCPGLPFSSVMLPPFDPALTIDSDGIYGWKHGFFHEREIKYFKSAPSHRMIIIVREAPTWILSAWKMNAMKGNIEETAEWVFKATLHGNVATAFGDYIDMVKLSGFLDARDPFSEVYYSNDERNKYLLEASSVFEARDKVQKNWLELRARPDLKDRIGFVRYENLLSNVYQEFGEIIAGVGIPCTLDSTNFDPIHYRVKMGASDTTAKPQEKHHRSEFCNLVQNNQALYQKIIGGIDLNFEKNVLGYDYPQSLEEYCRDAVEHDRARVDDLQKQRQLRDPAVQ